MQYIDLVDKYLSVGASIASILTFFISLFVAYKIVRIGNSVAVRGNKNITAGGNANVRR